MFSAFWPGKDADSSKGPENVFRAFLHFIPLPLAGGRRVPEFSRRVSHNAAA
jgi:hypothetical protein